MRDRLYNLAFCGVAVVTLAATALLPSAERTYTLGAFATPLIGRTASQRHNARLAVLALDGAVIRPGAIFSFVTTTGPWTHDRGYRKAPVSFDGELVRSFGGGVCQTSSTLYCAALEAGLQIVERHRHTWPAGYAPPGGDAAVAPGGLDLRLRNPYSFPVTIRAYMQGDKLVCRIVAPQRPRQSCEVIREVTNVTSAPPVLRERADLPGGRREVVRRGRPGYHVTTTRLWLVDGDVVARELIADDVYPPMSGVSDIPSVR